MVKHVIVILVVRYRHVIRSDQIWYRVDFWPNLILTGLSGFSEKTRSSYLRQDTNLIQKIVKDIIRKSDHEGLI